MQPEGGSLHDSEMASGVQVRRRAPMGAKEREEPPGQGSWPLLWQLQLVAHEQWTANVVT